MADLFGILARQALGTRGNVSLHSAAMRPAAAQRTGAETPHFAGPIRPARGGEEHRPSQRAAARRPFARPAPRMGLADYLGRERR